MSETVICFCVFAVFIPQCWATFNDIENSNTAGCLEDMPLPRHIWTLITPKESNFKPFKFHSRNFGYNEYSILADFQDHAILNIKLSSHTKPDSVTSGDLDAFYSYYASFIVVDPDLIRKVDGKSFHMEMWNLYTFKKDSLIPRTDPAYPRLVSLNVLFEPSNGTTSRLDALISGLTELTLEERSSHLPYNFDPYALLPEKSALVAYKTTSFPFPYPEELLVAGNDCLPPLKVYVCLTPLSISTVQLEVVKSIAKFLEKNSPVADGESPHLSTKLPGRIKEVDPSPIFQTPERPLIIVNRLKSQMAGYMLEFRQNEHGTAEVETYAAECKYLENVPDVVNGRMGSKGNPIHLSAGTSSFTALIVLHMTLQFFWDPLKR